MSQEWVRFLSLVRLLFKVTETIHKDRDTKTWFGWKQEVYKVITTITFQIKKTKNFNLKLLRKQTGLINSETKSKNKIKTGIGSSIVICLVTVGRGVWWTPPPPTRIQVDQKPDFFRNESLFKFQQSRVDSWCYTDCWNLNKLSCRKESGFWSIWNLLGRGFGSLALQSLGNLSLLMNNKLS